MLTNAKNCKLPKLIGHYVIISKVALGHYLQWTFSPTNLEYSTVMQVMLIFALSEPLGITCTASNITELQLRH